MGKSRTIPLARGLIGSRVGAIYGQLEAFLTNYKKIKIAIRRKPYSGHRDLEFSIPSTCLQDIIDILNQAKERVDELWLSKAAVEEFKGKEHKLRMQVADDFS